jgi:hypothetical protein
MHSLDRIKKGNAGFEVFKAVAMNNSVFWDIMSYNLLKVNRHFGVIYRLHLQCLTVKKQHEASSACSFLHADSSFSLPLNTEDEVDMFLRNIS